MSATLADVGVDRPAGRLIVRVAGEPLQARRDVAAGEVGPAPGARSSTAVESDRSVSRYTDTATADRMMAMNALKNSVRRRRRRHAWLPGRRRHSSRST
jgi:hypothetical protein